MWTVRSPLPAAFAPGRSRSMVSVPAMRRSVGSNRAGSAERAAGSLGFDSTWSRRPWDCQRDARRRRRCRRSRDCGGTARLRGRVAHMTGALDGLRVVEIADEISGPYCGKLFADLGAEVTKIEAPEGDSLRQWGPFPGHEPDPDRGGLFEYLKAGKRGTVLDVMCEGDAAAARQLIGDADVLIDASTPGTLDKSGLGVEALQQINPRLVVVRISNFGQHGPFRDRAATSLTMQAVSGWISARDPDRPPVQAGARIAEYVAGAYAALGALTALRIAPAGQVTEVDVSELEALLSTLPYPMLMYERMRALGLPTDVRQSPMLGVVRATDGWVGINCLTGQHWLDV